MFLDSSFASEIALKECQAEFVDRIRRNGPLPLLTSACPGKTIFFVSPNFRVDSDLRRLGLLCGKNARLLHFALHQPSGKVRNRLWAHWSRSDSGK